MEDYSTLTHEQLEQKLSQRVISLYQTHFGHQLHKVSCKLADKTITIVAEDSITPIEQFLWQNNQQTLATQVREQLHKALEPYLKSLIEEVAKVPIVDLICKSIFDTGRTSILAVLAAMPEIETSD